MSGGSYTNATCETVYYKCKANDAADGCSAKSCADYTKGEGISTGTTDLTSAS